LGACRRPAQKGLVLHGMGWPLQNDTGGGLFLYHWGDNFCSVGFVVHLNLQESLAGSVRRIPARQDSSGDRQDA
jgi:flavin-dependent dehydrogenase